MFEWNQKGRLSVMFIELMHASDNKSLLKKKTLSQGCQNHFTSRATQSSLLTLFGPEM